jgi:hypothetical protein
LPKVVIANRLTDGRVVFLAEGERWVTRVNEAQLAEDDAASAALLAIGDRLQAAQQVIDPELIDVTVENGEVTPTRPREAIRAKGPTNRPDLGKQAGND